MVGQVVEILTDHIDNKLLLLNTVYFVKITY